MPIGCEKAGYYKTLIFHIEKISQNHMESGKHKGIANKKKQHIPILKSVGMTNIKQVRLIDVF